MLAQHESRALAIDMDSLNGNVGVSDVFSRMPDMPFRLKTTAGAPLHHFKHKICVLAAEVLRAGSGPDPLVVSDASRNSIRTNEEGIANRGSIDIHQAEIAGTPEPSVAAALSICISRVETEYLIGGVGIKPACDIFQYARRIPAVVVRKCDNLSSSVLHPQVARTRDSCAALDMVNFFFIRAELNDRRQPLVIILVNDDQLIIDPALAIDRLDQTCQFRCPVLSGHYQ